MFLAIIMGREDVVTPQYKENTEQTVAHFCLVLVHNFSETRNSNTARLYFEHHTNFRIFISSLTSTIVNCPQKEQ